MFEIFVCFLFITLVGCFILLNCRKIKFFTILELTGNFYVLVIIHMLREKMAKQNRI